MRSVMPLQRKLTLSHLSAVIVTAILVAFLTLGGYWAYTLTDWSALWVADVAAFYADDIVFVLDGSQSTFDPAFADSYVSASFGYIYYDEDGELQDDVLTDDDQAFEEWIVVMGADGTIWGSSYLGRFPLGESLFDTETPGLDRLWPLDTPDVFSSVDIVRDATSFAKSAEHYVALAPIISYDDELLGYVYYRADNSQALQILEQTAKILSWGVLGATVVAIVLAGIMSNRLARPLAQRIGRLSGVSDAFAAGDFSQRIDVDGEDEIGRLSAEFNQMAEQIETQIDIVRDFTRLDERNRLARDLHDAIKQQLFGLNLTVGSIPAIMEKKPAIARQRMLQASEMTQHILEEMDAIIQQLRPASLEDQGLVGALTNLIDQWQGQTETPVAWTAIGERELPLQIEQTVYRIAQEALNNIARHANAHQVIMTLEYDVHELRLMVADDGQGFDVNKSRAPKSHGLRNMQERSAEIGGTFKLSSQRNKGSAIHLRVPIADGFQ